MTQGDMIEGRCLCGAVTVTAQAGKPILRACHCAMCRQWTSSAFMSIPTVKGTLRVEGPVRTYRSSDWAERGFCETCGSALWYKADADPHPELAAGLFDNAGGARLRFEFFADSKPEGYAFSGDHRKLTAHETIALFAPQGEAPA